MTRTNRYATSCRTCQAHIPAGAGTLTREAGAWKVTCAGACAPARTPARPKSSYCSAVREAAGALNRGTYRATYGQGSGSRRACVTGGNCSSHSGRNCGGHNCDAN